MRSPGRPRATPYATAEVLDAVASPDPAIEVPATRYLDFTKIGAAQTDRRRRRRPGVRSIFQDISPRVGPRPDESRDGRQCAGRPAHSPDLARHRTQRARRRPRRRARVTTDICLTPIVVASGERVEADFVPFGRASAPPSRSELLPRQRAAVDHQHRALAIAGLVGAKIEARIGHLLRRARPLHRRQPIGHHGIVE